LRLRQRQDCPNHLHEEFIHFSPGSAYLSGVLLDDVAVARETSYVDAYLGTGYSELGPLALSSTNKAFDSPPALKRGFLFVCKFHPRITK
jgi:hypothetical protein